MTKTVFKKVAKGLNKAPSVTPVKEKTVKQNAEGFLWPPRPTSAIPPGMLNLVPHKWAQVKKNGTCTVIRITNGEFRSWTRHNEPHKMWEPLPSFEKHLLDLAAGRDVVLVGELLHNKTPHIKHVVYFHDMLVLDEELTGVSYKERYDMLLDFFGVKETFQEGDHYVVNENTWIARNYTDGFKNLFDSLSNEEDEGLVLKDPESVLAYPYKPKSNTSWSSKCRKPHANYGF